MNEHKKKARLFPLDFIRVIGAVLIVLFHFNVSMYLFPDIRLKPLLFLNFANGNIGHIGVSLFFILSGASLMYTYEARLKPADYFKKRFMSIYPLFWVAYSAFFIHHYVLEKTGIPDIPRSHLLLSAIGIDGYLNYLTPTFYLIGEWFLGCIILIYLLFPLLRLAVQNHPRLTPWAAAAVYVPLVLFYPFQMDIQHFVLIRVPEVLFGMYFIRCLYGTEEARSRFNYRWGTVAGLVFAFMLFVPVKLPLPFLILLTGISCFLFLIWIGQLIRGEKIRRCISVYSNYTFALFLVHHILSGKFIVSLAGQETSRLSLYTAFFRYFLYANIAAYLFYHVSRVMVSLSASVAAAANRRREDA